MASSFSSYYVARSGIQVAQYNLKITGQNMSNVKSTGYTRQRLDAYALASSGNNKRYANPNDLAIGDGVEAAGVSQMRDPFLDVRYRAETGKVASSATQLNTLSSVEDLFDETITDKINSQITDLIKQLNTLAGSPADTNLGTIVRDSAKLLTQAFHNAASQLEAVRKQETDSFENSGIDQANSILKSIAQLNREIKSCDISQVPALELRDQRNLLLDQLSEQFNISISSSTVSIGAGRTVEEMQVSLVDGTDRIPLIDNDDYVQFEMGKNKDTIQHKGTVSGETDKSPYYQKDLNVSVYIRDFNGDLMTKKTDDGITTVFNDSFKSGVFQGYLTMLNDNGEFDAFSTTGGVQSLDGTKTITDAKSVASTTRGIGYYEKVMDSFAKNLAETMNKVNSTNAAGNDKPLFSPSEGTEITAANISISKEWENATGNFITASKDEELPGVDNSKSGKNILYMVLQFSKEQTFTTAEKNGISIFTSSYSSFASKVTTTLGLDIKSMNSDYETYLSNQTGIDTQRASISSVDLSEEGINLVMFNQALTASSRFMTTMDEAIDTIINKMGIVGR